MKIVHLCLTFEFVDGMGYQENLIAKYQSRMGNQVTIIAYEPSNERAANSSAQPEKDSSGFGITVIRLTCFKGRLFRILRLYKGLSRQLRDESPDVIFIHGCQFLDILKVVNYIRKKPDVKVFVDNHADHVNSARNWVSANILHKIIWRYCAKAIEPYTDKFFGVTPSRCAFLKEMYHVTSSKIELLVMGADDEKIDFENIRAASIKTREELNIKEDDFVLVTGGKIDRSKNIHLLMQSVCEINNDKLKLIVFGTASPDMNDEITRLSLSSKIINIGWIPSDQVYTYYLCSDLAVFPGTHSVLWEQAVGTGIPCVFKYWDGADHIDLKGNCRFLYQDSVAEMKAVILSLLSNHSEYDRMKKVADGEGKKKFWYSEIAKKSIAVSGKIIDQRENGELFAAKSVAIKRKVI